MNILNYNLDYNHSSYNDNNNRTTVATVIIINSIHEV